MLARILRFIIDLTRRICNKEQKPSFNKAVIIHKPAVCIPPQKKAPLQKRADTPPAIKPATIKGSVHRIRDLAPCSRWFLCIDEVGSCFCGPNADGGIVGVLVPGSSQLRYLPPEFHAADESFPHCAELLNELLKTPCGIIGIRTKTAFPSGMTSFSSEWICSVKKCIHEVLRQMPLNGKTKLSILIEQRGEYDIKYNTRYILEEIRTQFSLAMPNKARRIQITMLTFSQKGSLWLGWADLTAHFWSRSANRTKKNYLAQTGLVGRCLLENVHHLQNVHNIR